MAQLDSLESVLNRKTLFIKDIDESLSKTEVKLELQALCPKELGKICVPVDYQTAASLRCAYCNFERKEYAEAAFKRNRFSLKIKGKPVKVIYAVDSRAHRDLVFGPKGLKFFVVVKNLNPSVDAATLCNRFEQYGEVFQCKVDQDHWNQCFGMVQFVHAKSVMLACQHANNTTFESTVIIVEPHKNSFAAAGPSTSGAYPAINSRTDFPSLAPSLGVAGHSSAADTPRSTASSQYDFSAGSSQSESNRRIYNEEQVPDYTHSQPAAMHYEVATDNHNGYYVHENKASDQNGYADHHSMYTTDYSVPAQAANGVASADAFHPLISLHAQHTRAYQSVYATSYARQDQQPSGMPIPVPVPEQVQPAAAVAFESRPAGIPNGHKSQANLKSCFKDLVKQLDRMEELLCCPITTELFKDPVIASDGNTYERKAIEEWLTNHNTSPMTNDPLPNKFLIPNKVIRDLVVEYTG